VPGKISKSLFYEGAPPIQEEVKKEQEGKEEG
jgi:hypothetical protein